MSQLPAVRDANKDQIVETKPTPAEIIRRAFEERLSLEEVIKKVEGSGFGGKDGRLNTTERGIVAATFAECRGESLAIVQDQNDKIMALFEHVAEVQGRVAVGTAAAVGAGVGRLASSMGRFFGAKMVPTKGADEPTAGSGGPPTSAAGRWARFNKRGWFAFATLLITALVSVGVTAATQSWQRAAEAARTERDALNESLTRITGERDALKVAKAEMDGEFKNLKEQLDVAAANASTYRDRYNELAGRASVAPDVKELQTKLDSATARLVTLSGELGQVQGQVQSSKEKADGYKKLYDQMVLERDAAKREVRTIQAEKDKLQDELVRLRQRNR